MIVAATILALFIAASHEHKSQTLISMFGVVASGHSGHSGHSDQGVDGQDVAKQLPL